MKKLCTLLCMFAAILSIISTSAFAAEPKKAVIDLGDGYYAVETIIQYPMGRAGDTVSGAASRDVYYGSKLIGSATLIAIFDISGSSAKAIGGNISGSGSNGGKYINGDTSCSGNTAYGSAIFGYNGGEKSIRLTLSCSPSGVIS